MTPGRSPDGRPREGGAAPLRHLFPAHPVLFALALFASTATSLPVAAVPVAAQVQDTARAPADSARAPAADGLSPDTLAADSLPTDPVVPDTLAADTLGADTIVVHNLPRLPDAVPEGWERGVFEWDRDELLASRANNLAELIGELPGVIQLRGGDYGLPRGASAFGAGGAGLRVYRDGVERLPMEGSTVDLARISLGGAESVRVERTGSYLRVDLRTIRSSDPRPYSVIQAGTGDLDTNLLNGVFFHPRTLGGNLGLALDRVDTRGPRRAEPTSATSVWARYAYLAGDRLGLVAELTRSTSDRDTLFAPRRVTRDDWTMAGRWEPVEDVVGELFWNRATLEADSTSAPPERFPFRNETRSQWGARVGADRGPLSARLGFRGLDGPGLPDREWTAEGSARRPGLGGVAASWSRSGWAGRSGTVLSVRGWTAPLLGFTAFGSFEDFERPVPVLVALPIVPAAAPEGPTEPVVDDGRTTRVGGRFAWRGLDLSVARLDTRRRRIHPLGLPMDRFAADAPGGTRGGWETAFRVPLVVLGGLALEGSGQLWDDDGGSWPYFPRRTWKGALTFHDTFYPTENLEVWMDFGVDGRDRMDVLVPVGTDVGGGDGAGGDGTGSEFEIASVPFYQSWYARLQVRVVTVHVYLQWENVTLREGNQDFPGRVLPTSRVLYGVRWTLWN